MVFNTTPLITLGEIGLLPTVGSLYGEVWVPIAVVAEYDAGMRRHPARPPLSGFPWISMRTAPADALVPDTLDPDERETIALARAVHARLVLIDERSGRTVATRLNLPLSGSIGVLLDAKRHGLIPLVHPYLDQMVTQGRRISARLLASALELADESATPG